MTRFLGAGAVLAFTLQSSFLLAQAGDTSTVPLASPMQREWFEHRFLPWDPDPPLAFRVATGFDAQAKPSRTVLGYLPYWNIGKPTLVLHFDRLHVLAYFGASVGSTGSLGDAHHWGGATLGALIDQAHAADVLVVLAVTNFDPDSIAALLSSASARATAVSNLVTAVVSGGGDGVNVDFEGLPKANKADFVTFIRDLKQALDASLGRSHVSIATPAVDWSGAFDYDLLAEASDGLFIMGYDYHWRGGQPGPVSPLAPSAIWGTYSLSWTIDDYLKWGKEQNRDRFILGLPLYGFDWPTTGPDIPGTATDKAEARFYARCQTEGTEYGWRWDDASSTPYYVYQDPGWHQVWCEDRRSLAAKYALIAERQLGGVGFWALGYEQDWVDVWEELDLAFPPEPILPDEPETTEPERTCADPESPSPEARSETLDVASDLSEPQETAAGFDAEEAAAGFDTDRSDIAETDRTDASTAGPRPSGSSGCRAGAAGAGSALAPAVLFMVFILVARRRGLLDS